MTTTGRLSEELLGSATVMPGAAQIAMRLKFPVIQGMPLRDLLRMVHDNRPDLIRFRATIRRAIEEQVSAASAGEDADKVASRVYVEVIEPELATIQARLQKARHGLSPKIGIDIGIGGAVAIVGALTTMPLIAATGVAAVADAVRHTNQYLDEKKAIEDSDLYFLWHAATQHGNH